MKKGYDFGKAKRGAVLRTPPGKTRITIRIDDDVLESFRKQAHAAGGGNYQTMMNDALREHVEKQEEPLEQTLRRVLLEVLPGKGSRPQKQPMRRKRSAGKERKRMGRR